MAAILALLIGYGIYNGSAWVAFERKTLAETAHDESTRLANLQKDLDDFEAGRKKPRGFLDPRSPAAIGATSGVPYAGMPPAPLAVFSIGQSDIYPYYFKLGLLSKQTVLSNNEIENPLNLLSGRFDVAFTIVYLMPLLILALTYNLVSEEKENQTLAMALSQPVRLSTLMGQKILFRAGLLFVVLVVYSLSAAFVSGSLTERGAPERFLLWTGAVIAYGAFWFALALAVNALGKSSATNALILSATWLALVLVIPSAINGIAEALYPVPSRVEMIQAMREASRTVTNQGSTLLAKYFEDHPEMAPAVTGANAEDASSITYQIQIKVDAITRPVLDHFDDQITRQQAFTDRFRILSPAILTQLALNDISGTGIARYRHFVAGADQFLTAWKNYFFPRIFRRVNIAPAEVANLPRYAWKDEPFAQVSGRTLTAIAGVLAPTLLLALFAARRLRRYPVV